MLNRILLVILLAAVTVSFLGCQTIQGVGSDIKWTGERLEEAAE